MKKYIKQAALLMVATAFLLTQTSYAYYGDKGDKECAKCSKEERYTKLTQELGLTAEQEAQLKKERETFKAKQEKIMESLKAKHEELRQELEKPAIDRAKVDKIIGEVQTLTGEKMRNRVDKIIGMKTTLTPEQFSKLQEKMEKKRHEGKGKFWHHKWFKR